MTMMYANMHILEILDVALLHLQLIGQINSSYYIIS